VKVRCALRAIRGRRPLSALAAETGINAGSLSLIENGRLLPRDAWVSKLESAYGAPKEEWYPVELWAVFTFPERDDGA